MTAKESIVIFGAGGHAKVVADAIRAQAKYMITAVIDPEKADTIFHGIAVRANELSLEPTNFIVALGNNQLRKEIFEQLRATGWKPALVIHPSSIISPCATVSGGTVVFAGSVINPDAVLGENCIINTGATVDHDCVIGAHSHIAPGCHIAGAVTIGDGVFLGMGTNVTPLVSLGSWCTVGAGAAVVQDVEPNKTVVGVPARPISTRSKKIS